MMSRNSTTTDQIDVDDGLSITSSIPGSPFKDQRIPDIAHRSGASKRALPAGKGDRRKVIRRRTTTMMIEPTVEDHLQGLPPAKDTSFTNARSSRTTYADARTPEKPRRSQELHLLVEQRVYQQGPRSPQLMGLVPQTRTAVPLRIVMAAADYIERIWAPAVVKERHGSTTGLTNYMAALIYRVSPSMVTLFTAVYYIGRLRRIHPQAKGEPGCGHRLLTVALLLAFRYHECRQPATEAFYQIWSQHCGGLFAPPDLHRMEMEMVSFLRFSLYIAYDDLEYFIERVFSEGGQVVPRCLDIPTLSKPAGWSSISSPDVEDEDAAVPNVQNLPL